LKYNGNPASSIFDSTQTAVADDGKFVKVFPGNDNEWGFSNRMVDVGLFIAASCRRPMIASRRSDPSSSSTSEAAALRSRRLQRPARQEDGEGEGRRPHPGRLPTIRTRFRERRRRSSPRISASDGKVAPEMSLEPVGARPPSSRQEVIFADDCVGDGVKKLVGELRDGQVLLLENRGPSRGGGHDDGFRGSWRRSARPTWTTRRDGAPAHAFDVGMVEATSAARRRLPGLAELKHCNRSQKGPKRPGHPRRGQVSDKIKVIEQS